VRRWQGAKRQQKCRSRAFRDWGAIFDVDNTLATAMIDRLMHHGEAIVIRGDSYRMKDKPTE
jgi:DNA replication protein DnaC